jgi:TPR repeat protein
MDAQYDRANADGTFGIATPYRVSLTANGTDSPSAPTLAASCVGYVSARAPTITVTVGQPLTFGRFFTHMSGDPTLLIRDPNGGWHCNDDSVGLDAMVELRDAPAGLYRVWVGHTQLTQPSAGELLFTRDPALSLGTLRDETGRLVVTGRVCVTADVPSPEVYVDQQLQRTSAGCIDGVPYGSHTIAVRARGFASVGSVQALRGPVLQFSAALRTSGRSPATALEEQPVAALQAGCDGGQAPACLALGHVLSDGVRFSIQRDRALAAFTRGCTAQNAECCALAGEPLFDLAPAEATAREVHFALVARACALGHPFGCRLHGLALVRALGVARDVARGATLLESACDHGELTACVLRAKMLTDPQYGPVSPPRARSMLARACEGSVIAGCAGLASLLAAGAPGVARDLPAAFDAYQQAAVGGDLSARIAIGAFTRMERQREDQEAAFLLLDAACHAGRAPACERVEGLSLVAAERRVGAVSRACGNSHARSCHWLAMRQLSSSAAREQQAGLAALGRACTLGHAESCELREHSELTAPSTEAERLLALSLARWTDTPPINAAAERAQARRTRGSAITVVFSATAFGNGTLARLRELRALAEDYQAVRFLVLLTADVDNDVALPPDFASSAATSLIRLRRARQRGPTERWVVQLEDRDAQPSYTVFAGNRWIGSYVLQRSFDGQTLRTLIHRALVANAAHPAR